jgi:hypothetical protein
MKRFRRKSKISLLTLNGSDLGLHLVHRKPGPSLDAEPSSQKDRTLVGGANIQKDIRLQPVEITVNQRNFRSTK